MTASIVSEEQQYAPARSELTVDTCDWDQREAWNGFVNAAPRGLFFHLFEWHAILADTIGFPTYYLWARRDEVVRGVLPLARMKHRLFGDRLVSVPFCVEGGILAADTVAREALMRHAQTLAEELRVDCLELRHTDRQLPSLPCNDELYVSFRKRVSTSDDENLKAIPRKQRAMVRKGIKAGLRAEDEATLANFWPIYAESVRNHGTPIFPKRYFQALLDAFPENCRVTTVFDESTAIASVMSFKYKDTIMPYYGGGLASARRVKAFDFMYWSVMCRAAAEGYTVFDYGRSKKGSGSYSFKKNWGFEPVPLHYEYYPVTRGSLPDINPNNPKYHLAITLWKKLPLPIANTIGPWIAPYLS